MEYKDVPENNKNITFIKNLFVSESFPHTVLLEGVRGCGKFAFSKTIAKTIVCENLQYKLKHGDACGECTSCRKAEKDVHSDISVLQSESTKSIHIDKIREYIDNMYLSPNDSDKKVCIIRNADELTPQAQNSLLKSLEEPPPFLHFILTVQRRDFLLETIQSRSIIFTMSVSAEHEMEMMRPDNAFFEKNKTIFTAYVESLVNSKSDILLKLIYNREFNRDELLLFYSYLEIIIRDISVMSVYNAYDENMTKHLFILKNNVNSSNLEVNNIENIINSVSQDKIRKIYNKILKYKSELEYNANARLNLVNFLVN